MKELILSKWDEILDLLVNEHGLSLVIVTTWVKPLKLYTVEDKKDESLSKNLHIVYFTMEDKYGQRGLDFILNNKMIDMYLMTCIKEVLHLKDDENELEVVIKLESDVKEDSKKTVFTEEYNDAIIKSNLNPNYTFETFIVGDSNRLAHATSVAVAESPGQDKFNPLFLYGGAGLGKTHLMQSIAHYILQNNKKMKVLYVQSNKFTNEIIDAIEKRKTEEFRDKYRNVDVLLIDDIQYLIGKSSTQSEFFDTFNSLYDEGKQIILSSDKPPKEIKTLDERFRSRFEWGVPIDINAPDYETRMAILRNKVELNGYKNIDDDILEYIATNITSNVRELEGALNKINKFAELMEINNSQLTDEMVKDTLKDLISKEVNVTITPSLIINTVSEHLNISVSDIKSTKRSRDIATARQISMYLCRKYTDKGSKTIGEEFGGKDHSTVLSNVNQIEKRIKSDPEFSDMIDVIIKKLNPQK